MAGATQLAVTGAFARASLSAAVYQLQRVTRRPRSPRRGGKRRRTRCAESLDWRSEERERERFGDSRRNERVSPARFRRRKKSRWHSFFSKTPRDNAFHVTRRGERGDNDDNDEDAERLRCKSEGDRRCIKHSVTVTHTQGSQNRRPSICIFYESASKNIA